MFILNRVWSAFVQMGETHGTIFIQHSSRVQLVGEVNLLKNMRNDTRKIKLKQEMFLSQDTFC